MKKQIITMLTICCTLGGLFTACNNADKTGELKFSNTKVSTIFHVFDDSAMPACFLNMKIEYAKKAINEEMKDCVNKYIIASCLGSRYIDKQPEPAVQAYADRYILEYRNTVEPMIRRDQDENIDNPTLRDWYSYFMTVTGEVKYYQKNLLIYSTSYEEYAGSPDRIFNFNFLNLDLRTLTPIHLDDLFVEEYQEALTELLWNQLMVDNKVTTRQELEEMGYGSTSDLKPIDNFYLTPRGITFHYNVYEIAPYAMGNVTIHIPYEQMEHILSDDYAILQSIRKQ
ncbi:MAG: DUF3298 domain-containing protein [Bacteroides sp.]|nr:DUF3298 domain-containing protein [Bacteroides sp.]